MPINIKFRLSGMLIAVLLVSACEKTPADYRAPVTLPEYTQGNADQGAIIYGDACAQCHQLTPGLNKKRPAADEHIWGVCCRVGRL